MNKFLWNKYTISWYLLDMGSSFTGVIGLLYFSQWIVIDNNIKEAWYTAPTIIATIFLLLSSTHVGFLGDKYGRHYKNFKLFVIGTILSLLCAILAGYFLGALGPWVALFFMLIYTYLYQLTLVPYASFIKTLVPEELYGKLSGFGMAFGQLGSIVGILVALPILSMGGFSGHPRLDVFTAMMILFALFSIPSFILLKSKNPEAKLDTPHQDFKHSLKNGYKEARNLPGVMNVLISFYLFSDAIMTAILYFGIFLEKVLHVNDTTKSYMYLAVTLGFAIGAFVSGLLSDIYNRKKVLFWWLPINATCIVLVAFVTNITVAYTLYLILGITIGGVFSASRSYLSTLAPLGKQGTIFGLYTFSEKAASIVGPLIWLVILTFLPGKSGYQLALCILAGFTFSSMIPLLYKPKSLKS